MPALFYVLLVSPSTKFSVCLPIQLTGNYDRSVTSDGGVRVCSVEFTLPAYDTHRNWASFAPITDIVDACGQPADYWELRRALLHAWLEELKRFENEPRGMSRYERQERSFDAY